MIVIKTEEEVELMRISAMLVSDTIAEIAKVLKPGITTLSLDELADTYIRDQGAIPSFYDYGGYPYHICTSLNTVIVNGHPGPRVLRDGDVLKINAGAVKNEFHGDVAYTFIIGETSPEVLKLVKITKESLFLGIEAAIAGNLIGEIASAIKNHIQKQQLAVVKELGGHGIGRAMQELPPVSNIARRVSGIEMRQNLVLAIEPVANLGNGEITEEKNGSYKSADGSIAAHFAHDVCIRPEKAWVLSDFAPIEKAEKANKNLNSSYYD